MIRTESDLKRKLDELLSLPGETEVVEFKRAKNSFDFDSLGCYFSALSNEANIKGQNEAWLIFGVVDKTKDVVGSEFRLSRPSLDSLKKEITDKTTNRITFIEIHELLLPQGRVILFEVPAAPPGIPVAWKGHYYGRDGESLGALNLDEISRIRMRKTLDDWSAVVCLGARIEDLDPNALAFAKVNFSNKNPHLAEEVKNWDDITFLNKSKISINGKLTRTAILLLGKPEAKHFISPAVARISWVSKDQNDLERDYFHFTCPFLLAVDDVYQKIRNLKYRYLRGETLFPDEIDQYAPYTIREALNNCIAHQDYTAGGKINIVEKEDELIFANLGKFLPESIEEVIRQDTPQEYYRNPFLAHAMVNLKMIDTIGSGIKKMFISQRERLFPMPEFDISQSRTKLTIIGKVLDLDYARVLAKTPGLTLEEIMLLDKVQKKKKLNDIEAKTLKNRGLIEGRKPNYHISIFAAQSIADDSLHAQYIQQKGLNDEYYRTLLLEYIAKFSPATRGGINELLMSKLPDVLSLPQKKNKINNLIKSLRENGKIKNTGSYKKPNWEIISD